MNTNENHGHHDDDAPRTDEDGVRAVKVYGFRIDKKSYENPLPDLTGRDLLVIAGKAHPDRWKIFQKVGAQLKRIGLDEVVHVSDSGEERFVTLPLDQTEGSSRSPAAGISRFPKATRRRSTRPATAGRRSRRRAPPASSSATIPSAPGTPRPRRT
ncbi:multiubiquitin domain-containing protein [Methylobacterium gregans]|uniref:multiubiquitin domain-containing protein n=1 Tax=Methylobacteriaceae TaxID=119045 RepID=UPI0023E9004D|nr:hypothetical protein GCM10025880_11510 [Methylorubrum aminovorans]